MPTQPDIYHTETPENLVSDFVSEWGVASKQPGRLLSGRRYVHMYTSPSCSSDSLYEASAKVWSNLTIISNLGGMANHNDPDEQSVRKGEKGRLKSVIADDLPSR